MTADPASTVAALVAVTGALFAFNKWMVSRLYKNHREEIRRMDSAITSAHKRIDETEKRFLDIREALAKDLSELIRQQDARFDKLESNAFNQYHVLDQKIDVIKNHLIHKGNPP